jgi:hypothetical protein
MWVYKAEEGRYRGDGSVAPNNYAVGFYDPGGYFVCDSDHGDRDSARERVNYLNGGDGLPQGPVTRVAIAIPEINNL